MSQDQVVVITGASSGIGAQRAERLGARGTRLVLAARRERELADVAARSGEAHAVIADVSRRENVQRLLDQALERFEHIDVWVNNAGRGISRPVSQLTDDDVLDMFRVNTLSALYGMQAVLPHFQARGRGHIINVSSMLGRVPFVGPRAAYSAAKHALNALTASLRLELRDRWPAIHVSTVSPGIVATDFGLSALHGGPDSRRLPVAQPPEEVAQVIVDLIDHPRADVYTRPGMQKLVVDYLAAPDMAEAEAKFTPAAPNP